MRNAENHKRTNLVLFLALTAAITVCSSDRVKRADLTKWTVKRLPDAGIELDVPRSTFDFAGVQQLHHRSNGIADATWFIQVSAERKSKQDLQTPDMPSPENPLSRDADYMAWLTWLNDFHPQVSRRDGDRERQYRRDITLANGDIASLHARYVYWPFTESQRTEDNAAIVRILSSAKPLVR